MRKVMVPSLALALGFASIAPISSLAATDESSSIASEQIEATTLPTDSTDSTDSETVITTELGTNLPPTIPADDATVSPLDGADVSSGGISTNLVPVGDVGGDTSWAFWETTYYNPKLAYSTAAMAASVFGTALKIPQLSIAGTIGSYIVANKGKFLYIKDVKYWRMNGGVLQVKNIVSYYKYSNYTGQVGSTVTYYTKYD